MLDYWIKVAVGICTLISMAVAVFVAYLAQKARADFAVFKAEVTQIIREELKAFLTKDEFDRYSSSHGGEHVAIHSEITRLRDFKHDSAAVQRETGSKIESIKDNLIETKTHIEKIVDGTKKDLEDLRDRIDDTKDKGN